MRLLLATDAWHPQVNGVVRSLERMSEAGPANGAETILLTPQDFASMPMPGYPEIRLSLVTAPRVLDLWEERSPTHVHIATEGPIGYAVRRACMIRARPFTTSYHTRFPEYLAARAPVPESWSYGWLRRFHAAASGTMVSTASLRHELSGRGFSKLMTWTRGVDTELFRPRESDALAGLPGPIFLFVGRLAIEKNIEAFLSLDLPGTKVLVGDGPDRARLQGRYPDARFLGTRTGEALAQVYAAADAFVFPSLTDTFGIVLLEALACGVPVAAFPVTGPLDIIEGSGVGVLDGNLRMAALAALDIPRERCRAEAMRYTWAESARQFYGNIDVAHGADYRHRRANRGERLMEAG